MSAIASLRAWAARYFTRDNAVLWIAGTLPDHLSALRSPAQATSKIFSKLWPFCVQPLMIWIRSRFPESGSLSAATRKEQTDIGTITEIR